MSKGRFKLNRKGVRELLKSQEMMNVVTEYADQVQKKAGDGYEVSQYIGKNRVNVSVYAETRKARKDNLEHNTLLKALGGSK